jgi:CheY-like chemotaxis protein
MSKTERPLILLVDDIPENIDILVGLLERDYELSVAVDGSSALNAVKNLHPDMILLDVMMPEISGYDVCRRVKASPETAEIPVIFLTALSDDANEQQGLELGAVDYIAKPFNPALVKTRVANHLALETARRTLKDYNEKLERLVQQRTQDLEDALERLKAIDETKTEFLSAISHELRTPANGILGIGSLAIDSLSPGEEQEELRGYFDQSCQRLTGMLDSAMHLAELQTGKTLLSLEPVVFLQIVEGALSAVKADVPGAQFLDEKIRSFAVQVEADRQFLTQSMETLLKAAIKLNTSQTPIEISGEVANQQAVLRFSAFGQSVPEALTQTLFNAFSPERSASYAEELGLLLPVAEKMIRAMRGRVHLQNVEGPGFEITICLPVL